MPLYCPNCGSANEEFAEFCVSCGIDLTKSRDLKAETQEATGEQTASKKKLYRSRENRMLTGVAAGMAEYFGLEVALMRLLWIIFIFIITGGMGIIAYLILALVIDEEPLSTTTG